VEVLVSLGAFRGVTIATLERAVRAVLEEARVERAEISLTLLGDDAIRDLNRRYLGRDRPTDVLAFSLGTGDEPLGDVYVGVEQARRQARELDVPAQEEIVRLAIHGTLHVLGHDHPEGVERADSPMFALQERLVARVLGG
jgi:probable rRNA maturation factor